MFKTILVPLDGSRLSEASLDPAMFLARKLKATVILLHVIEQDAPEEIHKEPHLTLADEADAYLKEVAGRFIDTKVKIQIHVHIAPVSDVASSIVDHANDEFHTDLIVTSTHGRGGMRKFLYGSIAQQVVAQGTTALLLIKPESPPFKLERILIALDPDSGHDESLTQAESLANIFGAELYLLSVVPTYITLSGEQAAAGNLLPATAQAFLDIREENAQNHLEEHIKLLHHNNLRAVSHVARGDPAATIDKTAVDLGVDLIILSTHRKAGMGAFWARSVAPMVAKKTRIPLWLIPLTGN
jgi:nucleotide-binding universal stress UspA family protein